MYRIGEFSKMSKTTVKTLRYYDEIGLLIPEYVDDFTGYRFYTTKQLFQLHRIVSLRQIGLSIDEIKTIISGDNPRFILEKRKAEIISELSSRQDQLSRIEFILQGKQEDLVMKYIATIKDLPECIVYSRKMTIPNYNAYFNVIPETGKKLMKKYPDLKCAKPEYSFVKYLDGEYREENINIEYCEAVEQMKPDFDDICFKKIKSVQAVSVMHKGPYSKLREAYTFVYDWLEKNNYTPSDFPRESYIDGIWNKESEDEWLTEIQIPIKI